MTQRFHTTLTPPDLVAALTEQLIEDHLKIDYAAESAYVTALCAAAVQTMETDLGYEYGAGTASAFLDCMPRQFTLPMDAERTSSVVVTYIDEDGATVTVDPASYHVSQVGYPTIVTMASDFEPASKFSETPFPVEVSMNVAARDFTPNELQASLFIVAHWYENREAVDKKMHNTPLAYKYLLAGLKKSFIRSVGQTPSYLAR